MKPKPFDPLHLELYEEQDDLKTAYKKKKKQVNLIRGVIYLTIDTRLHVVLNKQLKMYH